MTHTAKDYLEWMKFSLEEQRNEFMRLAELQNSYDNKINRAIWPTQSEIPTAQHFIAVEEALAPALDGLFPDTNGIQLIPGGDDDVTPDQWRNAEWALWVMATYRMDLKSQVLRSIKDCFKCSVGYTIIEPFFYTPSTAYEVVTRNGVTRFMADGEPVKSIRARYISPGRLVPYPEGTDFNGADATPMVFMLDYYPVWQMEKIYEGAFGEVEMLTPLETVRKNAEELNQYGISELMHYADTMSGRKRPSRPTHLPKAAPLSIPIIRVWEQPGIETWISPKSNSDGDIVMRIEVEGQQQSVPLVKWNASPDADRWFPMSQAEADMKRAYAYDLWLNFFYDAMSRTKDAPMVIDKRALPNGADRWIPGETLYTAHGQADQVASYVRTPPVDPAFSAVGDVLTNLGQRIQGTSDFLQRNYTRGGTNAFQDLMNTAQARQRLSIAILESGGLKPCFELILGYMKRIVPEQGISLAKPEWTAGDRYVTDKRIITADDLRHEYSIVLDTSVRRMLGGMSFEERFRLWEALRQANFVHMEEVNRVLPLPEVVGRRVFMHGNELAAEQERVRAEEQAARMAEQGGQQGQQAVPPQEAAPPVSGMEGTEGLEGML